MLNYPHNDVLVTTARVALFLHLVLNYPVLLHPTRSSINLLFALLYNTLQSCLARKRQYRAESEPLLPKSSHTEFKVQGLSLFPTVSLHPQSSSLIDSPPSVVLRDLDHLWCYLSTSQFHTQCKTSTPLWATPLQCKTSTPLWATPLQCKTSTPLWATPLQCKTIARPCGPHPFNVRLARPCGPHPFNVRL